VRTDPRTVNGEHVDVLIVGGGIHGLAIARECALRGASTLLLERDDFACGTSMRSSRLMHGGVRYLQQGHFALVREAAAERERLLRLAPHLVRPLPMLMPFFDDGPGSAWLTRIGLWLYGRMARRSTLPRPASLSAQRCLRAFPGLRSRGLRSGVLFYDGVTEDLRLALAVAEAAVAAGARLANHTEVVGVRDGSVTAIDRANGADVTVRARRVVNCAGPAADVLRRRFGLEQPDLIRTSRGSHVVLAPREAETALAAFLPDRRIQFVIPHRDGTLCGTTDVDEAYADAGPTVPDADVDYLLRALEWLLAAAPRRADIRFAYSGWRSLPTGKGPPGGLHREAFTVEEPTAAGPMHTIVGGKWTTHRSFAERVATQLLGPGAPSSSRTTPYPGGDGLHDVGEPLWWRHGSRAASLRARANADARLAAPICPHRDLLNVEAVDAVERLGVVTFRDLALRRLFHSQGPCREPACRAALHALYAQTRGAGAEPFAAAVAALDAELDRMTGAAHTVPTPRTHASTT
jgi:glycerol-3-phosphate dehydrogenase